MNWKELPDSHKGPAWKSFNVWISGYDVMIAWLIQDRNEWKLEGHVNCDLGENLTFEEASKRAEKMFLTWINTCSSYQPKSTRKKAKKQAKS